jgi:hypothetical protein
MEVTLEQLQNISQQESVSNAIEWAKSNFGTYPRHISKPFLKPNADSKDAIEYAKQLEEWEAKVEQNKKDKLAYNKNKYAIEAVIESFIKEEAGISIVPIQYREKLWSKAWSDGHSSGYYDVYAQLCSLVDIFK